MEEKKKKTNTKEKVVKKDTHPAKKNVIKKKTSVPKENKETVSEKKNTGEEFKKFISSYKFLYTTFGVLFVLVIILAIMVFVAKQEAKDTNNSNIVFSIMETGTHNSLNMDLSTLVGKEYALKVTNFRAGKICGNSIDYSITILNDTDVELEVLANRTGDNLITDQKKSVIHGDGFGTSEKEEIIYYFRVKNSDKLKKGDSIQIVVAS